MHNSLKARAPPRKEVVYFILDRMITKKVIEIKEGTHKGQLDYRYVIVIEDIGKLLSIIDRFMSQYLEIQSEMRGKNAQRKLILLMHSLSQAMYNCNSCWYFFFVIYK